MSTSNEQRNNAGGKTGISGVDRYNELLSTMQKTKEKWDEEDKDAKDGGYDEEDRLLSQALDLAIEQGRGWSPDEKEAYLAKILDDDFIPPMFCSTPEEVEKSGLQDAFTSLIYDDETPTSLMLTFRKKGNDAFANGRRNTVGNLQYFRAALNHYYESLAWAKKIVPLMDGDLAQADTDDPTYTPQQLDSEKSTICSNIALTHSQLKNWGHVRDESRKALQYDPRNVKAWFRLAKAYQNLRCWEEAGDAVDGGLAVDNENADLKKLQQQIDDRVRKARTLRQQRERARAERTSRMKQLWRHCNPSDGDSSSTIRLGRIPLVSGVADDDDGDDEEESRWHRHLPHSGKLPTTAGNDDWSWPCLFL